MSHEILTLDQGNLRGTDSNSLLRLYDLVSQIAAESPLRLERARADKAVRRIVKELHKRNVLF